MPPPNTSVPTPDDYDAWAAIAADSRATESVRRGALDRLIPCINDIARRVSVRFAGRRRDDFCEGVLGDVWAVIDRFPKGGNFEAWCYTVLRNRWTDAAKWEQRREGEQVRPTEPSAPDLRAALEEAIDSSTPFGALDLKEIGGWPVRDRVVLLCLAGLWRKVPGTDWQRWVGDHRTVHGTPVRAPFPPEVLEQCDRIAERNSVVADELHLRHNTLAVILHRGKERLLELRYVRDRIRLDGRRS